MDTIDTDTKIKCSLCGEIFEPDENTCGGCIVRKNCQLICCPRCGFGMPRESKLFAWLKERRKKVRKA